MFFNFPTDEEHSKIVQGFPIEDFELSNLVLRSSKGVIQNMYDERMISEWANQIKRRFYDIIRSYVLVTHYYKQGILDKEWFISSGKLDGSTQYFPHMSKEQHIHKANFDFFADIFYHKLFSLFDSIGHLLNTIYQLEIDQPDLSKSIKKLKKSAPKVYKDLDEIVSQPEFKKGRNLRNNLTHNQGPNSINSFVEKTNEGTISFGVGNYITSEEVYSNIISMLRILKNIKEIISKV